MTSRELRKQRREAERKARKLEYQQNRAAAVTAQETCGAGSPAGEPVAGPAHFAPNPDLFDEFSAEEQMEMMAIRARIHRAGVSDLPEAPAAERSDAPAVLSKAKTQDAKTQERPGPTGPRSPEGKATSSGNSLKHGLASGRVIIPGEDPAEFEALLSDLVKEHAPANETECLLVQQMAQSWWLMQRAIRIQNQAFTETRVDAHKLALFLRYQTTYERAFYRALNTLLKLSRARRQAVSSCRKSDPEFVSQNKSLVGPVSTRAGLQPGKLMPPGGSPVTEKASVIADSRPLTAES